MIPCLGYAAQTPTSPLAPFRFERRDVGPDDVHIRISHCGVCHSDLHQVRDEWGGSIFPIVPGHEIVGEVVKVGAGVRKFKVGDTAGVGCLVGSCGKCEDCRAGLEQFCAQVTFTYNSPDPGGSKATYGGYSDSIIVKEHFALKIANRQNLAAIAPLLCAGITTYSPLKRWEVGKGSRVGIMGLGGLGHMGVKFARAFGAEVVVLTTSEKKREDAKRLGAHEVLLTRDPSALEKQKESFHFILNTVSAPHDLGQYLPLLRRDGVMALVGVPEKPPALAAFHLITKRRQIAGSLIGGLPETQEMLDYCAEREITSDVEVIPMQQINTAYDRLARSDVKYRFVIDMKTLV